MLSQKLSRRSQLQYSVNHTQICVRLVLMWLFYKFAVHFCDLFVHIPQGCFTGSRAILRYCLCHAGELKYIYLIIRCFFGPNQQCKDLTELLSGAFRNDVCAITFASSSILHNALCRIWNVPFEIQLKISNSYCEICVAYWEVKSIDLWARPLMFCIMFWHAALLFC